MKRLYTYIFIIVAVTLACLSCVKESLSFNTNGEAITELLEVPEEDVVFDGNQGVQSVTILTRYNFSASAKVDWIACSKLDNKTLQLEVEENKTIEERTGTVEVTIRDEHFDVEYSKSFNVRQTRGKATVDAYLIDGGWGETQHVTEYLVESFEENLTMYVKSNAEYYVSSDCDWITWSKSTSQSNEERDAWSLTIAQNNAVKGDNRVGHIYVKAEDAVSTITIKQSPFIPRIILSTQSKEINLSPAAATSKIIFYTNSSWKASCDADWITLLDNEEIFDNKAYNTNYELSFSVSANEGASMRSAIITIESADSSYGEKQTVIVNQDGAFMVSDVRLQYMEGYHTIDFNVSVDWVITCDATWLTLPTSGTSSDNTIALSVEENNSNQIRKAVVLISAANDSTMYTSFTVTQDHINTIYYHSNTNCAFYINQLTFGGAEIVEHIFDANSGIGRVVFDGEVISVERNEEMAVYPSWGYGTRVTLPPTIKTIGLHAFYSCPAITRIDLPNSVTSISEKAISNCSSLRSVYCEATTPPAGVSRMFVFDNDNCKIYVPNESVEVYKGAEGWKDYASQIYGYTFN